MQVINYNGGPVDDTRVVRVYRVEDIDGHGPWSTIHTTNWMYTEGGERDAGYYLPSHSMYKQHMRFAFSSVHQLLEAFAPTMLRRAFNTGVWHVAIYETCEEAIQIMDAFQITFDAYQAKLVKRLTNVDALYEGVENVLNASAEDQRLCA
jgi:hypothetical protein